MWRALPLLLCGCEASHQYTGTCTDVPLLMQGTTACQTGYLARGIFKTNTQCLDNGGCRNQLTKLSCCQCESCLSPFSTATLTLPGSNEFWDSYNKNRSCGAGYFFTSIVGTSATELEMKAWGSATCSKADNLNSNYLNSTVVVVPASNFPSAGGWLQCPLGAFISGLTTLSANGNANRKDAIDFGLLCNFPQDMNCTLVSPPVNSYATVVYENVSGLPCRHQGCNATQTCLRGYKKIGTGTTTLTCDVSGVFVGPMLFCEDMNECVQPCSPGETPGLQECHDCSSNATCINTPGDKTCSCKTGWAGNGTSCSNVNECNRRCSLSNPQDVPEVGQCHNCTSNRTCVDNQGWFTCPCAVGYQGASCLDVNECAVNCTSINTSQCNRCSSLATCANTVGSYTCTCAPGYNDVNGDGYNCTDVNECASACGPGVVVNCHTCQGLFDCSNTVGSFTCVCRAGYQRNGTVCQNIDECASTATNNCSAESTCVDSDGGFYCSPYVTFASISSTALNSTSFVVPGGTRQSPGDLVLIVIQGLVAPIMWDNITNYGSEDNPMRYQATGCNRTFAGSGVNVTCRLTPGSGANLAFAFQYSYAGATQRILRTTSKQFSYPAPVLLNGTLSQNGTKGNNLTVQTVFGQSPLITMDGLNLPAYISDAIVSFGPNPYICTVEVITSTSLSCRLAADGIGTYMTFTLTVSTGTSTQVANGTDFLTTVLVGPTILNMSAGNCTQTSSITIASCPTSGGNILTVTTDQNLVNPVIMLIAGGSCDNPLISPNNKTFTCSMPAATGVGLPTTFAHNSPAQFSPILQLVSYAAPAIIRVQSSACIVLTNLALVDCPVAGGGILTITGQNFGQDGAVVQLGVVSFAAQHTPGSEHSMLTVSLPSYDDVGWIVTNDIVVVQGGGQGSSQAATLTFAPLCHAGEYETAGKCINCAVGTFSIGAGKCDLDCLPCPRGMFQPVQGSSRCLQCGPGKFQANTGASDCDNCPAGQYSLAAGEANCIICAVGRYSGSGSSTCTACTAGRIQPMTNQSACLDCLAGTFTDIDEQVACLDCPAGNINGVAGSSCFACAPGRFNLNRGSSVCSPCAAGSFADQSGWAFGCLLCNPGRYQNLNGSTSCMDCTPGYEQRLFGQVQCTECNPGTYSDTNGQSSCSLCDPGTVTGLPLATSCSDCERGYFQNAYGAANCTACPAGQWTRSYRSTSCLLCSSGSYQNLIAQTACQACDEGRFSTNDQATTCTPCAAGYYQSAQGQIACQGCPAGRFTNNTGASDCLKCDAGFFSTGLRVTACQACLPGTYQAFQGQTSCNLCPLGQSNSALGASTCTNCDIGKYQADIASPIICTPCPIGNASSAPGATSCEFCDVGKFSGHVGSTVCQDCVSGWVWDIASTPPCKPCSIGKFSDARGLDCTPCPAGKYSNAASAPCLDCPAGSSSQGLGATFCTACIAGRFAQAGQTSCSACPSTQYSPVPNASACLSCPPESIVDKQNVTCLCFPGYYSVASASGQYSCLKCISGMNCVDQGVTVIAMETSQGFWRINNSFDFIRCPRQQYCLGGSVTANKCQPHRTGVLCGLCEPGYQANGASGVCEACPEAKTSYTYSVLILLLMACLLIFMFYVVLRFSNMQQKSLREKLSHIEQTDRINLEETLAKYNSQDVASAENDNLEGEDVVETSPDFHQLSPLEQKRFVRTRQAELAVERGENPGGDLFKDAQHAADKSASRALPSHETSINTKELMKTRTSPNFMYKVKILVGFFQVATILPFQGGIRWPSAFADFISIFSFLNFDFMPWQSIGCVASLSYFDKAIIVGCTPLLVLFLLLLFFYVPVWLQNTNDTVQELLVKQQRQAHLNRQFVKLTLFTVFLLYPFVSKIVLGVFNCIEVDGTSYLLADLSLTCFNDDWQQYAGVCGLFVVMYPFGIPAAYLCLLRKADLRDPGTTFMLGFLYEAYVTKCYYWEVVDMCHKLVLTGIVAFAAANRQLIISMAILVLYLEVLLWAQPYVRKGDDRFHLLVQIELYLLVLVGWILTPPNAAELTPETDLLISLLLIGLTSFLMSSFIIIAGRNVWKLIKHRVKKQTAALLSSTSQREASTQSALGGDLHGRRNSGV